MNNPLYVLGAGGHGKVVVSTLLACGFSVDGVLATMPENARQF